MILQAIEAGLQCLLILMAVQGLWKEPGAVSRCKRLRIFINLCAWILLTTAQIVQVIICWKVLDFVTFMPDPLGGPATICGQLLLIAHIFLYYFPYQLTRTIGKCTGLEAPDEQGLSLEQC